MGKKIEKKKLYSKVFPDRLKWAREKAGYSQQEVADKIEVKQGSIARYESGEREPDYETLIELSMILAIKIDWLIGASNELKTAEEMKIEREQEKIAKEILKKLGS